MNSHFKKNGKDNSFYENSDFFVLKNTLDDRMKQLSSEGKITPRVQVVHISTDELNILWEKDILGDCTPEQLLDNLVVLNSMQFAMCASKEHHDIKFDQIQV